MFKKIEYYSFFKLLEEYAACIAVGFTGSMVFIISWKVLVIHENALIRTEANKLHFSFDYVGATILPYTVLFSGLFVTLLLVIMIRLWQISAKKNKLIIAAQKRLAVQAKHIQLIYEATMIATNTEDFDKSMSACLNLICRTIGWPIGHIYVMNKNDNPMLDPTQIWYLTDPQRSKIFKECTEKTSFPKGIGLPGRVWQSQKPAWIYDVFKDDNFPRARQDRDIGVHAAIAFPIIANKKLIAVFEFFAFENQECDVELLRTFEVMSEQIGHVFERKISKNYLDFMAHHDSLTGVSNRIQFETVAKKSLAHAIRYNKLMAIFMLDLDCFKTVNDSLGHEIGDLLLQNVTKRFLSVLRQVDLLARWGGDEFAIIIDDLEKKDDALVVAKKLVEVMRQPFMLKENEVIIAASIGIALFPDAGNSVELLKRNADAALYKAKKTGGDRFFLWE